MGTGGHRDRGTGGYGGHGDRGIWGWGTGGYGDRRTALGLPLLGAHCALLCLTGTLGLAVTYCCRGEEENTMMKIAQKCNLQLLPLPGGLCAGGAAGLGGFLIVRASYRPRGADVASLLGLLCF